MHKLPMPSGTCGTHCSPQSTRRTCAQGTRAHADTARKGQNTEATDLCTAVHFDTVMLHCGAARCGGRQLVALQHGVFHGVTYMRAGSGSSLKEAAWHTNVWLHCFVLSGAD